MSSDDPESKASMAAQHPAAAGGLRFKVAPTDGSTQFNAIRIPLIPVACWRLNDPAFAFDSSFVSARFRNELTTISSIVASNPGCPAALFGHCDPAGSDALNKTLGDRRAIAIYATLTRQPDLWESLYANPAVGDTWGTPAVQSILAALNDGNGNPYYAGAIDGDYGAGTRDAVTRFQTDSGLAADGDAGPKTRKILFGAYMDWLCNATAVPFRMLPTDFLGGVGAQPGDLPKMSLQSCGKFNPTVLLTSDEMSGSDRTTRNADDALNRRVLMFFFQKGTAVDPSIWPCPKVKEPNDACAAAFWPDGDTRRTPGSALRRYRDSRDTMACRFYDRMARRSPCEGGVATLTLKLVSGDGFAIPEIGFVVTFEGGAQIPGTLDRNGIAVIPKPPKEAFHVEYHDPDTIRGRALTARLKDAITRKDVDLVCGVLAQSSTELQIVTAAYSTYFGGDLLADVRALVAGSDKDAMMVNHLVSVGQLDQGSTAEVYVTNELPAGGDDVA